MANRRNFVLPSFAVFVPDRRCTGTIQANGSLPLSWASHPSADRTEPPSLLYAVTGRKYHCPPAFHRPREAVPIFEKILLALHLCVIAYLSAGCRPSTDRRIEVPVLLLFCFQDSVELFLPLVYGMKIAVCKRFFSMFLKVC